MTFHPVMSAFCAESAESHGVDPCALVVIANWREQQFFVHAECLRTRLQPDVAVHAEVLDAPTG